MDSNGKLKTLFSPSIRFLRWFTLIISLGSLINIFFCWYRIQRDHLATVCGSFVCGLFFVLAQYFGNSDKWLYEKYRPVVFTVLGTVEMLVSFLFAILYGMLCGDSMDFVETVTNFNDDEYQYRRSSIPPVIAAMILSQVNVVGFACMTIGLVRWVFVETNIMEKIRSGFSQVEMKWPTSDRAFSVRGNVLRFLSLIAAIGSATLGYIYCNPKQLDAIWIISVSSCIVSTSFFVGGLIGLLQKLERLPLLGYFFLASETIISAIVGIFHALMYTFCIIQMTDRHLFLKFAERAAITVVMLFAEFNVIVFVALVYTLIRRAFAGRKLANFLPFPIEIDVDHKDPMTLKFQA